MTVPELPSWATQPIDLSRHRTRRLFAQEFVTRLAPLGSVTLDEARGLGLALFKVPPDQEEALQAARVASRLGWVEPPADADGGQWTVSELGRTVARPPSLAFDQVFTRLARLAGPIREQATDWLPLLAVVAGALTTAAYISDATTLDAVRILSLAVLAYSLAVQIYGEAAIVQAVRTWAKSLGDETIEQRGIKPQLRFYSWLRLCVAVLFDAAILTTFGLLLFEAWDPALVAGGAVVVLALFLEFGWRTWLPGGLGRRLGSR
jgi:hypothetical protein